MFKIEKPTTTTSTPDIIFYLAETSAGIELRVKREGYNSEWNCVLIINQDGKLCLPGGISSMYGLVLDKFDKLKVF